MTDETQIEESRSLLRVSKIPKYVAWPIEVDIEERGWNGLPDITISYYAEEQKPYEDRRGSYERKELNGFHIRTFKHRSKGVESICHGVDEFKLYKQVIFEPKRTFQDDCLCDEFRHDNFTPDYILTGCSQGQVVEQLSRELSEKRNEHFDWLRNQGYFVGELQKEKQE